MPRPPAAGIFLRDPTDFEITLRDASGVPLVLFGRQAVFTAAHPGPFFAVRLATDALGLLSAATITLAKDAQLEPLSCCVLLRVHDRLLGWQEAAEGFLDNTDEQNHEYPLEVKGLHELEAEAFYQGKMPPDIRGITRARVNLMGPGAEPPLKDHELDSNSSVFQKIAETEPRATWGVDGARRAILGTSDQGIQAVVHTNEVTDLSRAQYDRTDYVTEYRWDAGPGWLKGGNKRDLGPLVPKRAVKVDAPPFEEVTVPAGPPVLANALLTLSQGGVSSEDLAGLSTANKPTLTRTAHGAAIVRVLDLGAWHKGSALPEGARSTYEPLSALETIGFRLDTFPTAQDAYYIDSVVLDVAMFLSKATDVDPLAVGAIPADILIEPSPIHPEDSPETILVIKSSRGRLLRTDAKKPFWFDFKIPDELFRQDYGKDIREDMRRKERQAAIDGGWVAPDSDPEAQPPTPEADAWNGTWTLHLCLAWFVDGGQGSFGT